MVQVESQGELFGPPPEPIASSDPWTKLATWKAERVPASYIYVAKDEDGWICAFESKPVCIDNCWTFSQSDFDENHRATTKWMSLWPCRDIPGDWRKSLRKRPGL